MERKKKKLILFTVTCIVLLLLVLVGSMLLKDKQYLAISMLMIVLTLASFLVMFEKRNPVTSEMVLLSGMSGLAIVSRIVFAAIPQIKPAAAIIIITGVCFGSEAGFLTGAIVGFVTNFYFGQGPWTTYQILGFALLGGFAGLIFHKMQWEKCLIPVSVFGLLSVILLYGGIVNLSTVMMFGGVFSLSQVMAIYLSSLPYDLIHAISTMVFLIIIYKPLMLILNRIKDKYGFVR